MVAAKNSFHGSMNPRAQFQEVLSVADVLAARTIVEPLTLPMCSPIGDGAAAVILVSERKARELGPAQQGPRRGLGAGLRLGHAGRANRSARWPRHRCTRQRASARSDLSCVELHDASAPSEIVAYEYLGLCAPGRGRPADRDRRHAPRRPHPGQHVGRPAAQGTPGRRHRLRADRRADRAAAGALRQAPGRGRAHRAGAQRRRRDRHATPRPPWSRMLHEGGLTWPPTIRSTIAGVDRAAGRRRSPTSPC